MGDAKQFGNPDETVFGKVVPEHSKTGQIERETPAAFLFQPFGRTPLSNLSIQWQET
jgi:hypothetical protein